MKKGKFSGGAKALAFLFGALSFGITGQSSFIPANNTVKVRSNDAINQKHQAPRPVSIKTDGTGGDNPFKYYKRMERNQRQYRKLLRQVPTLRNSYKNKLKN